MARKADFGFALRMNLAAYLARIGFDAAPRPDLATLKALHRAHLASVPFENLDVQLGVRLDTSVSAAFDKIVTRGRGGWCFEMNGLFGWALGEIGFRVTRLMAGVNRKMMGDPQIGNHLALKVDLDDGPWLADVGFGDGLIEPIPLRLGPVEQGLHRFGLEQMKHNYLRFWVYDDDASYDFHDAPADEDLLAHKCAQLQNDPASGFVMNLVAQRATAEQVSILRGSVLKIHTAAGVTEHLIADSAELVAVLRDRFNLDVPDIARVWPRIVARHQEIMQAQQ